MSIQCKYAVKCELDIKQPKLVSQVHGPGPWTLSSYKTAVGPPTKKMISIKSSTKLGFVLILNLNDL